MDISEQRQLRDFIASKTTLVQRHANAFVDEIAESGHPRNERSLIEDFNHGVEQILLRYTPPSSRRSGDSLVFADIYRNVDRYASSNTRNLNAAFAAFFAAEVEFRGPLRLSRTQNSLLADIYEGVGIQLLTAGLPMHAALAFRQAAHLHTVNENPRGQDRCSLAHARARTKAGRSRSRRIGGYISDLLCGYGYRPFRLLAWIAIEIVLFTVTVSLLAPPEDAAQMTYLATVGILSPPGWDDVQPQSSSVLLILTAEAITGLVSTSVFFALLVRRLFRL
ncbi:hypothetical protein [Nocardia salmonicida]|uniref:hypothetical protein n=1 Tax=Nocardia salmonicida TaxID=53431 RepID=UPI002E27E501|nr:hypothetical protein [Nocardia salmonicida]